MKQTSMIESFLDGTMKGQERIEFERKIASNKNLADEVALHKDINEAIIDNDVHEFRLRIRSILGSDSTQSRSVKARIPRYIVYPVVAAILFLIGLNIWYVVIDKSSVEIYNMFYYPYQTDTSTRSFEQQFDVDQASYILYQEGDYEASFEILEKYLVKNYHNQTAHFYYGMNALELKKYDLAIKELKAVAEDPATPFSIHAHWYLAMIYLKTDHEEEALDYLNHLSSTNNLYSEKAAKILRML